MKILILASNPRKDLNLDHEIRDLKQVIERSHNRQQFEVENALAVRVGDLQDLLFKYRPQIVHFCGHGSGEQGLVFEGNDGGEQCVRAEALSDLFRLFSSNVGCVLLNACYSEEQANAIVNHIDYVIGMNQEIRDDAAIAFSKGFYRALGYDRSISEAFEFGKNAIQLEISGSSKVRSVVTDEVRKAEVTNAVTRTVIPEHLKPILKRKPQASNQVALGTEQPLSQSKREAIQLDVANALIEDTSSQKQYREKVREFLVDRKLTKFEEIRLEQLRKNLGLSVEEANQILAEEQKPLQQACDDYAEMLIRLVEEAHYPFDAETEAELCEFRQELQLTDEEVAAIAKPILEAAEDEYREKLEQGKQQEYQANLQRYEQEFRKAIDAQYPINSSTWEKLRKFQQSLGLGDEDVAKIEEPSITTKEAEYQHRLEEDRRRQEEAKQKLGLERQQAIEHRREQQKREYQAKLQQYEQEFIKEIEAEFPLGRAVRHRLSTLQKSLGLHNTAIARIEEPLIAAKEAAYQQQLKQQREQEQQQPEKQRRHKIKLQRYGQEFEKLIDLLYPIDASAREMLNELQRNLGLSDGEVIQIEGTILTPRATKASVDYTRLRDLLQAAQWKEADEETAARMLEVMNRQQKGYLGMSDIVNFPCPDLREIDRLWIAHSHGRFGFSTQQQIWQECGSPSNFYTADPCWQKFGNQVGWRKGFFGKEWIRAWSDLTFSSSAPKGHLPFKIVNCVDGGGNGLRRLISLLSRTKACSV